MISFTLYKLTSRAVPPKVGFIRAPSIASTGWRLRYAMMYADRYDQTKDTFGLKSPSSQPVRLNNVRKQQ